MLILNSGRNLTRVSAFLPHPDWKAYEQHSENKMLDTMCEDSHAARVRKCREGQGRCWTFASHKRMHNHEDLPVHVNICHKHPVKSFFIARISERGDMTDASRLAPQVVATVRQGVQYSIPLQMNF
jgi:hypothetical protein